MHQLSEKLKNMLVVVLANSVDPSPYLPYRGCMCNYPLIWGRKILISLAVFLLVFGLGSGFSPVYAASPNNQARQTVIIETPVSQVFPAAAAAFQEWERGELISVQEDPMQVKGLSRTNFFKFIDDITVSLSSDSPNQTRLDIESVGRVGEYDFGGNQRNITEYVEVLNKILFSS